MLAHRFCQDHSRSASSCALTLPSPKTGSTISEVVRAALAGAGWRAAAWARGPLQVEDMHMNKFPSHWARRVRFNTIHVEPARLHLAQRPRLRRHQAKQQQEQRTVNKLAPNQLAATHPTQPLAHWQPLELEQCHAINRVRTML